jgi:tripartite-type tricarboxylate transporter receptor subunit TctC
LSVNRIEGIWARTSSGRNKAETRDSPMHRRILLASLAAGLAAPMLRAQAWPDRPIRLIVPWPPGGSTDTIARIFQPKLAEVLGKPEVIDNRGAAAGSIGAIEAARSAPDGTT